MIWMLSTYIIHGNFVHIEWNRYFMGMALATSMIIALSIQEISSRCFTENG